MMKQRFQKGDKVMKTNERKYLDISTAHLTQGTFGKLNSMDPTYAYNYGEGAFITVPSKEEVSAITMPYDLRTLLQYAWDNNIDLIQMDRDAEFCDELPIYNWKDDEENKKLAERVWACLSDGYDDEEYRVGTIKDLMAALNKGYTEPLKLVMNRLCERIEDMEAII